MKKVTIQKLDKTEIQVLQLVVTEFSNYLGSNLRNSNYTAFLDAITLLDISGNLYYFLRNKIEKDNILTTLKLSLSQAATISKCCHFEILRTNDDYSKNLMLKISNSIDQQLKSII